MTRDQFDQAVEQGYHRLLSQAGRFTNEHEVFTPGDLVDNALTEFMVKRLDKFEFTDQARFEKYLVGTIGIAMAHHRELRAGALDFHMEDYAELEEIPDPGDDALACLERVELENEMENAYVRLHQVLHELNQIDRSILCALLAGFTQEQVAGLEAVSQQRVSFVYHRTLAKLRSRLEEADGYSAVRPSASSR